MLASFDYQHKQGKQTFFRREGMMTYDALDLYNLVQFKHINNKQMSLQKHRIKSAQATSHPENFQKKRRYDKVATQTSQQFHNEPQSKIRSYSRQSSKKGHLNSHNLNITKQPQQMIEQNLNLKMFINNLQEQLALQRGRLQMNKRKTQKFVKQLNRQFDKELYYSGKNPHSYMFSGIKQQYENIKHLYDQKCQQMEKITQSLAVTNFQELCSHIEALQDDNKHLKKQKDQMKDFIALKNDNSNIKLKNASKGHKHSQVERLYTEFNESEQNSKTSNPNYHEQFVRQRSEQATISHFKSKCKEYEYEITEYKKKIKFLEQLIIEKDNNEHHAKRQAKKITKEKRQLQIEIKRLNQIITEQQKKNTKKINTIIEVQSKKFEIESTIFKKSLLEKNEYIGKLQKQIRFLSTILSYWKPLDQINRNDFLNLKQPSQKEQYPESIKGKANDNVRKSSVASDHFMPSQLFPPNLLENQHDRSIRSNREEDIIKRTTGARSQSQQNVVSLPKERMPQTCGKKTKSSAKKCRKIELRQIKGIGQMLRYRLIGNNFNIEKLKQLFDLSQECLEQDREFRTQYISMREIKNILMNTPFNLNQQQAVLTSRYIVQDEISEFVYWDQDNEIKRTIAKSIIKSLIGDYTLPNIHEIESQWDRLKTIYLHNIQSALKIIAPKGIISEAKFIELLVGLGIELKEQLKDWLIAIMVIQSSSLNQLNYRSLIPQ